jgi:hypothetical protein
MYASVLETGRGFFAGACAPSNVSANSYAPPQPSIREIGCASPSITT